MLFVTDANFRERNRFIARTYARSVNARQKKTLTHARIAENILVIKFLSFYKIRLRRKQTWSESDKSSRRTIPLPERYGICVRLSRISLAETEIWFKE